MDRRERLSSSIPEDGPARLSSSPALLAFARFLSIAGNPLFLTPITVFATSQSWRWSILVALTTTVPLVAIIRRNVRRGTWSDFDASRRDQRLGLYIAGLATLLLAAGVFYVLDASPRMMRALIAGFLMLAAGILGHRFLKTSMHMMFTTFCAVLIVWQHPRSAPFVIVFIALLGWSRRYLDRHTWTEIVAGTMIGIAAGWFTIV